MQNFTDYIKKLQKQKLTDITEHSHRAALESLLNSVAKDIVTQETNILHEPKRQGKNGSPDFMISTPVGIIGYVENKKITQNLEETILSDQINKYKKLNDNLLITNYVEFVWLKGNEITREKLCEVTDLENKSFKINSDNEKRVSELIKKFLAQAPQGIADIEALAFALAERAKYLFVILYDYLLEQEQNEELQDEIWGTYQAFVNTVYEDLTVADFTDTFAQTLTYGLFIAKLNIKENQQITLRNIDLQIPNSFALIKNIVSLLKHIKKERYSKALWIVEELLSIINNIDLRAIQESLSFTNRKKKTDEEYKDPYIYFYENFLAQYNPRLRKSRGVYYTPHSVVRFIISAIDDVLKDKQIFALKNGIADYEKVNFLDFAAGTGTFLLEILEQLNQQKPFNKPEGNNLIKKHINNIYGFEFLIAPYAISHLKLTQYLKENGFDIQDRLQIYLTNTLEDKEPQKSLFVPQLSAEGKLAQKVKRNEKILVITGNPPYSGSSSNASFNIEKITKTSKKGKSKQVNKKVDTWIGTLIKDYYKIDNIPIKEANSKWLQDDYVKFIRFAQYKVEQTGEGIVAIVTNHAFLENPTFRAMRYNLMQTFDQIYIVDLHGNTRKLEKTPEGEKDENVFDIQQGVSISILIKRKGLKKTIKRADFWGKRDIKNQQLFESEFNKIEWQKLNPSEPFYMFSYQNQKIKKEYFKYLSVKEIFQKNSLGIFTHKDKFLIDFNYKNLNERLITFKQSENEKYAEKKFNIKSTRDWNMGKAINIFRKEENKIFDYQYRPFDNRKICYNQSLYDRGCSRYEMMESFIDLSKGNLALNTSRMTQRQSSFSDVLISNKLTDAHFCTGGNYVFPIYTYIEKGLYATPEKAKKKLLYIEKEFREINREFKKLLKNKKENIEKLGELAQEEYNSLLEEKEVIYESKKKEYEQAKEDLVLSEYDKIENINTDFRKFINDKYEKIYSPEQILAYIYGILHCPTYREKYANFLKIDFPRIPFLDNINSFEKISELGQELINAHLMEEIPDNEIAETYDGVVGNDTVEKVEFRKFENVGRIYINKTNYFENIPEEIFEFYIGGYKVIDKYLKSRKGKDLQIEEIQQVKDIAKILAFTIEKMKELDNTYT